MSYMDKTLLERGSSATGVRKDQKLKNKGKFPETLMKQVANRGQWEVGVMGGRQQIVSCHSHLLKNTPPENGEPNMHLSSGLGCLAFRCAPQGSVQIPELAAPPHNPPPCLLGFPFPLGQVFTYLLTQKMVLSSAS